MSRLVALTGSAASGKSTVAALFAGWGATLIDADAIVHALQRPGTAVFEAIVRRFGREILRADGTLDRAALRRLVLDDPGARTELEAIVHPAVQRERDRRVTEARARGTEIILVDIPLLFEVGDPDAYDAVVVVDAPLAERRMRLETLRGLPAEEAAALIAAQLPAALKRARADVVIDNDGSLATLERRARGAWEALRR